GWFVDHWAAIPLFASQAGLPAEARAALRERRLRGSAVGYANSLRGMGAGRQPSLWDRLPALEATALLVSGEIDIKYVAIHSQMAGLLAGGRQISVPGAGHTVHLERREVFAQLVVGFLSRESLALP
ncbi:MAG: 2-succinyl-6-hydroxy-2,4-cyclohexadiene-1-carboxylate synthase, partial [Chloroflexales bacterium]|nr:2-succinyl-6-hydroxy-2,4-cyclohexadiene-1-carboxylate synthase [Chloroflexales bacterium]